MAPPPPAGQTWRHHDPLAGFSSFSGQEDHGDDDDDAPADAKASWCGRPPASSPPSTLTTALSSSSAQKELLQERKDTWDRIFTKWTTVDRSLNGRRNDDNDASDLGTAPGPGDGEDGDGDGDESEAWGSFCVSDEGDWEVSVHPICDRAQDRDDAADGAEDGDSGRTVRPGSAFQRCLAEACQQNAVDAQTWTGGHDDDKEEYVHACDATEDEEDQETLSEEENQKENDSTALPVQRKEKVFVTSPIHYGKDKSHTSRKAPNKVTSNRAMIEPSLKSSDSQHDDSLRDELDSSWKSPIKNLTNLPRRTSPRKKTCASVQLSYSEDCEHHSGNDTPDVIWKSPDKLPLNLPEPRKKKTAEQEKSMSSSFNMSTHGDGDDEFYRPPSERNLPSQKRRAWPVNLPGSPSKRTSTTIELDNRDVSQKSDSDLSRGAALKSDIDTGCHRSLQDRLMSLPASAKSAAKAGANPSPSRRPRTRQEESPLRPIKKKSVGNGKSNSGTPLKQKALADDSCSDISKVKLKQKVLDENVSNGISKVKSKQRQRMPTHKASKDIPNAMSKEKISAETAGKAVSKVKSKEKMSADGASKEMSKVKSKPNLSADEASKAISKENILPELCNVSAASNVLSLETNLRLLDDLWQEFYDEPMDQQPCSTDTPANQLLDQVGGGENGDDYDPPLLMDDLICSSCRARTFIPEVYWESNGNDSETATPFLCTACLLSTAGHDECELADCPTCIDLAAMIRDRLQIADNFRNGTLVMTEFDDDKEELGGGGGGGWLDVTCPGAKNVYEPFRDSPRRERELLQRLQQRRDATQDVPTATSSKLAAEDRATPAPAPTPTPSGLATLAEKRRQPLPANEKKTPKAKRSGRKLHASKVAAEKEPRHVSSEGRKSQRTPASKKKIPLTGAKCLSVTGDLLIENDSDRTANSASDSSSRNQDSISLASTSEPNTVRQFKWSNGASDRSFSSFGVESSREQHSISLPSTPKPKAARKFVLASSAKRRK